MPATSIAAAEQRVIQSRHELYGALARLGARLAQPPSLVAAALAGALAGFAIARQGGLGPLARTVLSLYVRYRTEQASGRGQDIRL